MVTVGWNPSTMRVLTNSDSGLVCETCCEGFTPGDECTACTDFGTDTPAQYRAVITGADINSGCLCGAGMNVISETDINGTHILTQTANPCFYSVIDTISDSYEISDARNCPDSGVPFPVRAIQYKVTVGSTVEFEVITANILSFDRFLGTTSLNSATGCAEITINNSGGVLPAVCSAGSVYTNGTVVLTAI